MSDLPKERGLVLVLCAPSGTGKSTLVHRLHSEFDSFVFSVSYTTRAPRGGEVDGRDYHFTDRDRFKALVEQSFFCEWAEVHGNFYGTPEPPVHEHLEAGRDVLFDIDVQGARQLANVFPDGLYVFVLPPSRAELERRLRGRGTDDDESILKRLKNAAGEMAQAEHFDYLVVNDDLDAAYEQLRAVYLAGRARRINQPGLLARLRKEYL